MKKILTFIFLSFLSYSSFGTPTQIIIRAKAKDAKFIGTSVGGAYVIVRDKLSGEILSQGKIEGSTGNTQLIMKTPQKRGSRLADEQTAKFVAQIDIKEPTFVRIEVFAPVNKKQATVSASTELWVIPGKDILGDGIVVEIPGFIVDILKPQTHQFIPLHSLKENSLPIEVNLVMMCGCTISDGGLWDSNEIEVKALLKKNGEDFAALDLQLTAPNFFEGNLEVSTPGNYELVVYAYHPGSGNTGVDKVNYILTE